MVEERKREGRGETEFVWIKPHMSRNGALDKKHTDQDKKAEEIAKDKGRETELRCTYARRYMDNREQ